ncbi:DUF4198 domain-containing protein [Scandinavium sp. V105_16]|uniref:DUF4198 domain-containing protein n=1 Tax=Scandinavium lactucae TaxID=3095028 RepID=A0AAJ2RZQ6_9ENTR|nr:MULTISPECIES: DUF4198 domain-containing protein [unclassified Scandinavium]MDX6021104.1 DUF4198 domain-containing protein [Scandinavium sp. V105_16]MDX6031095.1 DUF4198 domain-containing protein [Scandinavium sp. V105_12]MDX6041615.1 DUF4198 domain-containing protein [Scandinavium sp. V105_6]MDX6049536.1 DUF4198 domain-containing protein [Scandinavium sp. V105_1]
MKHPFMALTRGVMVVTLSLFSVTAVQAHEFWMIPHNAQSRTGEQVVFELRIGSGLPGKQSVRFPGLISTFIARDARGKYAVSGRDNSRVIGHLRPRASGATVVALRTNEAKITLPASEFNAYLEEEGLTKVIHQRQQESDSAEPATELFSRCGKSIILVDGKSAGFDQPLGQPLEVIPLTEPFGYQPGQPYRLRLLRDGKPLVGAQIKAQLQGKKRYLLKAVSNAQGEVAIALPEPGVWLFSAVDMVPAENPDADWQSLWASVTLDIGERRSS